MRIYARKLNRRSLRVASVMLETIIPRSLRLPSRLHSSLPFATSFLSFQHVSTLPFHSLLPLLSFRFNASIWVIYLFLSFHKVFISLRPSIRFNSYIPFVYLFVSLQLAHFICYFFPLVSTLAFHSLLLPFRFNSSLPFATSFLSFQLFPSIRYFLCSFQRFHPVRLPLLSFQVIDNVRSSHSFQFFNSYIPFVYLFVALLQLVYFVCYFFPLIPTLAFRSLLFPFPFNSFLRLAMPFFSFQFFPSIRCFLPSVSALTLCAMAVLNAVSGKRTFFLKSWGAQQPRLAFAIQAATCGHLRPLCGHLL